MIDGAHAPAMIPLNLQEIDCDFYGGNCHKWLLAPTGAGFLCIGPGNEDRLQPLQVSWGWHHDRRRADEQDEFGSTPRLRALEFEGTRDPSPWLTVPTAIDFQAEIGFDRIRARIERVVPGFESYNHRVRQKGGFYLPNGPREGVFPTASGRAQFTVAAVPQEEKAEDELFLMTIRSHDQFNTTVYDLNDRYRGIYGHRHVLLMNRADLDARGLKQGDKVIITSHFRGEKRRAAGFSSSSDKSGTPAITWARVGMRGGADARPARASFHALNGSRIRITSSRSGLVETSAIGVSISSCTRWIYLIACAGRSA